ncbi:MAG: right-handed parallel beta-helix repeat-containing protein [Planctomycetota bacterium]
MTNSKSLVCGALLGVAALLTLSATAPQNAGAPPDELLSLHSADPRTRIRTLPYTITRCGSYYLGACLTGTAGFHGIEVLADDVTIDLNGFTLRGTAGSRSGVRVGASHTNLAVHNGVIRGWGGDGIDAQSADNARFFALRLSDNGGAGARVGTTSSVRDCVSARNADFGYYLAATQALVQDCISTADGHSGATNAAGILVTADCLVRGNSVDNSPAGGVAVRVIGSGNRIENNHVSDSLTGYSIQGVRTHVLKNTYERSIGGGTAFAIQPGNNVGTQLMTTDPIGIQDPWANFESR